MGRKTTNGHLSGNPFAEGDMYGGGIEIRFSESFGMRGIVTREYSPFTRKWRTNTSVSPIFYKNKK